jgi:16S rRNA (adenine1518-N6/adenine1519-N6)-dimethyltransferase
VTAHQARKRFGQHFLADDAIVDRIVRCIAPQPGQAIVEIGPGLGALTLPLLAHCPAFTVIELDRDLAARLRKRPGLTVVENDVLNVNFAELAAQQPGQRLRVVGNLPYNISTPILFHLLGFVAHVEDQHFMLQKEVVMRMAARPDSADYGRLSVMLQWRYDIEAVLDVPPEAFEPPPRVQSAVVRMLPLPADHAAGVDALRLGELVATAFSQRRKLLRHTLGRWLEAQGLDTGFDLQRRAQEVPVAEYVALAQAQAKRSADNRG